MDNTPIYPAFLRRGAAPAIPVTFVTTATWPDIRSGLEAQARAYADAAAFEPRPGRHLLLPGPEGTLAGAIDGAHGPAADLLDDLEPAERLPPGELHESISP